MLVSAISSRPENSIPALEVQGLTKIFRKRQCKNWLDHVFFWRAEEKEIEVVKDVSFQVHPGEIFGLLGRNGSGKSTVIRTISTLLSAECGEIKVFGMDLKKQGIEIRKLLSRVSVEPSLCRCLTAQENLVQSAYLYQRNVDQALQEAFGLLGSFDQEDELLLKRVEQMSRGQQQKVAITRAVILHPRLLLLDEPTTGLDPASKRVVQNFLLDYVQQEDRAVLLSTHDMAEAEKLCSRMAFIKGGRIVAEGSAEELKQDSDSTTLEDAFIRLTGQAIENK